jgi:hypothetical protein
MTLTVNEKQAYQRTAGQEAERLMVDFVTSPEYKQLTNEQKAIVLKDINVYAEDRAKKEFVESRGGEYESSWDKVIQAQQSGVDPADYFVFKQKHDEINDGTGTATDKATEFSNWLDEMGWLGKPKATLQDTLSFLNIFPADSTSYDEMTKAGLADDTAKRVYDQVSDLTPPFGFSTVQDWQQIDAICNMPLSDSDAIKALSVYAGDSQYKRYATAHQAGISPPVYNQFRNALRRIDDNDSVSRDDVTAALQEITGLSREQMAIIWAMNVPANTKTGNPYGSVYQSNGTLKWAV